MNPNYNVSPAPFVHDQSRKNPCLRVSVFYGIFRSVILWLISGIYFLTAGGFLIFLSLFFQPKKTDRLLRIFFRHLLFLAGATLEVRLPAHFDPHRTYLFVANHVNLFDPCVLVGTIPQFARGLELDSHFKIPFYGWLAKGIGNIPVPAARGPAGLKRMWKLTKDALEKGTSLVILPEGTRTRDGRVGPFKDGAFRMAIELGYPILPISICGSFEFNRKTSWMLRPSKIIVHFHDAIETKNLDRNNVEELRERTREIISAPVNASLAGQA